MTVTPIHSRPSTQRRTRLAAPPVWTLTFDVKVTGAADPAVLELIRELSRVADRTAPPPHRVLRIDPFARAVRRGSTTIELSRLEFDLLLDLGRESGPRVQPRAPSGAHLARGEHRHAYGRRTRPAAAVEDRRRTAGHHRSQHRISASRRGRAGGRHRPGALRARSGVAERRVQGDIRRGVGAGRPLVDDRNRQSQLDRAGTKRQPDITVSDDPERADARDRSMTRSRLDPLAAAPTRQRRPRRASARRRSARAADHPKP